MSTISSQGAMHVSRTAAAFVALSFAGACARTVAATSTAATTVSTTTAASTRRLPNDVRWFRTSAEYRALARQAYRIAEDRLPELTRGLSAGTWAVILDADETVLDNSEYQRRRAMLDSGFTDPTWVAWVRERAAVAVPGAVEFTRAVRSAGGRVAIVTNRADSLCNATRENLATIGVQPDIVLCQPARESDKNPRFQRIQQGTAAPGMPALTVVAWIGDNIQDFPTLSQAARNDPVALAEFGRRYFMLPNPMYGSWERNQ